MNIVEIYFILIKKFHQVQNFNFEFAFNSLNHLDLYSWKNGGRKIRNK
jgi:hypothetical protein